MENISEIFQATKKDLSQIALFLDSAPLIHRHLDWRNTFEWLDEPPFLVLTQAHKISAILVAVPDPPGVAWIRCFAVGRDISPDEAWILLSKKVQPILASISAHMVAVGLQDWFTSTLLNNGFSVNQKIVVLEWSHHLPLLSSINKEILIRPMEIADIPEVSIVDKLSFEPIWVNSVISLKSAFLQSEHTSVAEVDGRIVAYEMSTGAQYNAHLARLAVLPEFRGKSIGRSLVAEMLVYFSKKGILQLTVNTQNDNLASLHLYQSLGFRMTLEEYPVLN
ncbi:MAG: GNAT family N-acetyltransferase [Anaerolineaceae bacterium]